MSALAAGLALLVAFAIVESVGARLGPRGGATLRWLLAAAFAVIASEFGRFDHGHPEWLTWIGFVAAPVIVIFGGAAWGVRRWYGWPDFGPMPGRLALVSLGLLAGVLVGQEMKAADVEESQERGVEIWTRVKEWRAGHAGEWPRSLEEVGYMRNPRATGDAAAAWIPRTRMGGVAPPPFTYDAGRKTLSFPIRTGTDLVMDLDADAVQWKSR